MSSFTTRNMSINMNIIQIYVPTNEASNEDKDVFYSLLLGVIDNLSRNDANIVMGDANAKIDQDNVGYEGIRRQHGFGQIMNGNGERFANICAFNSFVIGGSVFSLKKILKVAWVSQDGVTLNQINHFCISHRFSSSLEDVKVQ
ncbi:uncharacterized protein LOC101861886 [Aplysia californica]|uniref:Uncharacterized protein LOC101861886 n=1 Tax=Aplysia californica TaxID=6500 RepID=A0ABM0JM68_APLCA|nr:uncharacterized protein LOC101861886 [Aplysia californica]